MAIDERARATIAQYLSRLDKAMQEEYDSTISERVPREILRSMQAAVFTDAGQIFPLSECLRANTKVLEADGNSTPALSQELMLLADLLDKSGIVRIGKDRDRTEMAGDVPVAGMILHQVAHFDYSSKEFERTIFKTTGTGFDTDTVVAPSTYLRAWLPGLAAVQIVDAGERSAISELENRTIRPLEDGRFIVFTGSEPVPAQRPMDTLPVPDWCAGKPEDFRFQGLKAISPTVLCVLKEGESLREFVDRVELKPLVDRVQAIEEPLVVDSDISGSHGIRMFHHRSLDMIHSDDPIRWKVFLLKSGGMAFEYETTNEGEHFLPNIDSLWGDSMQRFKAGPMFWLHGRSMERSLEKHPEALRDLGFEYREVDGALWLFALDPTEKRGPCPDEEWMNVARELADSDEALRIKSFSRVQQGSEVTDFCPILERIDSTALGEFVEFLKANLTGWLVAEDSTYISNIPYRINPDGTVQTFAESEATLPLDVVKGGQEFDDGVEDILAGESLTAPVDRWTARVLNDQALEGEE